MSRNHGNWTVSRSAGESPEAVRREMRELIQRIGNARRGAPKGIDMTPYPDLGRERSL
jgi:hypothetical protein